jgi:hypothetical protein
MPCPSRRLRDAWTLGYVVLVALSIPTPIWSCSCGAPKPACAYLAADAIFLGRVAFTNDDGSGKFTQATLVRFDIEERFKGVTSDINQIWVDPGSNTSCYENYKLGERYLIFGRKTQFQSDSAAITIMPYSHGKRKPLPRGFDPDKPPTVYYAPECAGSRPADDFPHFDQDLALLRAYRAGTVLPRVLGSVFLYPFRGWPALSGPRLKGARITMSNGAVTLRATTDEEGRFSLGDAPAGVYKAWADLPPFRVFGQWILHVPEVGCGYTDIQFMTTSTLQGIVLDHLGKPAPNIPVVVRLRDEKLVCAANGYALTTTTDASGQFAIAGVPDSDVYLSAGSPYPTTAMPYRRVYYPKSRSLVAGTVLRLKPGEHKQSMVLWLEEPLQKASAKVRVLDRRGKPEQTASVWALNDRHVIAETVRTDAHGVGEIPCLRGMSYELEAHVRTLPRRVQSPRKSLLKSSRVPFTCGNPSAEVTLILEQTTLY